MNITGWVLTKCDLVDGLAVPVIASMSIAWHAPMQPLHPDGWSLVLVQCDKAHYDFFMQDEDVIWIGREWSKVPPELLTAYADKLDSTEQYLCLGQVIDKLCEWDLRFLMRPAYFN